MCIKESDLKITRQKKIITLTFYKSGDCIQIHQAYSESDFAHGSFQTVQPSHYIIRMNPNNLQELLEMLPGKFCPIVMLSVGIAHSLFRCLLSGKHINQVSMKEV